MKWSCLLKKGIIFALLLLSSIACSGESGEQVAVATVTNTPPPTTVSPTVTALPTATATPVPPTATPTTTPTPTPLSPSALFDRIAPSIAFVETPLGSGSAILVQDNYLVTNAHVIWPYSEARVVFSDGSEFEGTPLLSWDLMADLAVLGPIEELVVAPVTLADGEAEVVGSDVYLVGYPSEVDAFPQPTITRGLISRKREWEREGITFFQTDATVAGGQSGGALVSEMGEVIGISGFAFGAAEFGLVASASDLVGLIDRLIVEGEDESPGHPLIDYSAGKKELVVSLDHAYSAGVFLAGEDCGPTLTVVAESEHDLVLQFVELLTGEYQEIDETLSGVEQMDMPVSTNNPYLVAIYEWNGQTTTAHLESSCNLIPLERRDLQQPLDVDETVAGTLDYPGDDDVFTIDLSRGETVNLLVDAVAIDPILAVTYADARFDEWVQDDDSGGGLFGTNADLTFQAPHTGRFIVMVSDAHGYQVGGYTLSASSSRAAAPTPMTFPPTPEAITTDFGEMQHYGGERFPYTMLIPASWDDVTAATENCYRVCFRGDGGFLVIAEEDVAARLGLEEGSMTRQEYISAVLQGISLSFPQATLLSRTSMTTESGLVIEYLYYRISDVSGTYQLKIVVAFEDGIGFNAIYIVEDDAFSELEPMIDYSFRTLSVEQ